MEEKKRKSRIPEDQRKRKVFTWGQVTQKMMSFKIDLDLVERLKYEANKGRLINNLLRNHYGMGEPKVDGDTDPREHDIEEYMT